MILDTTFVIDLQRELRTGKRLGAKAFLQAHDHEPVRISIVTWMEFAEGYGDGALEDCKLFLSHLPVIGISEEIAWAASRFARILRAAGAPIGDHDLWLAATAVHRTEALVSRNLDHFRRIPDLRLIAY